MHYIEIFLYKSWNISVFFFRSDIFSTERFEIWPDLFVPLWNMFCLLNFFLILPRHISTLLHTNAYNHNSMLHDRRIDLRNLIFYLLYRKMTLSLWINYIEEITLSQKWIFFLLIRKKLYMTLILLYSIELNFVLTHNRVPNLEWNYVYFIVHSIVYYYWMICI